jgi:hypothetical protein
MLKKVIFELDPADWHGMKTESVWAEPIKGAQSSNVFTIMNSPFFTRLVSYLDIVRANYIEKSDTFEFLERIDGAGHSTYRLIQLSKEEDFKFLWKNIEILGCSFEQGSLRGNIIYAVDVPNTTSINDVYEVFEDGQKYGIWMFEEGRFGHHK